MRRPDHLTNILLAVFAAALLLSACGGSGDESQLSESTSPTTAKSTDPSKGAARSAAKAITARHVKSRSAEKHGGDQGEPPSDSKMKAAPKSTPQRNQPAPAPKPVRIKGCPTGLTRSQCADVGRAYEQTKGDSTQVKVGECPPSMSKSECQGAGETYQEAEEAGQEIKPTECPRAMTAEQCAEAGKLYEEATK